MFTLISFDVELQYINIKLLKKQIVEYAISRCLAFQCVGDFGGEAVSKLAYLYYGR